MNALRNLLMVILLAMASATAHASMPSFGFGDLEQQLRLNPDQKAQFDVAVAASQRAFLSIALVSLQMKDRIGRELAKPRPDLDALARAQNDAFEQVRPLFNEAHVEWARLYSMLDTSQVEIAKAYVEDKLGMFERASRAALDAIARALQQPRQ